MLIHTAIINILPVMYAPSDIIIIIDDMNVKRKTHFIVSACYCKHVIEWKTLLLWFYTYDMYSHMWGIILYKDTLARYSYTRPAYNIGW